MSTGLPDTIFRMPETEFSRYALEVFHLQYQHNPVYRSYIDTLGIAPREIKTISRIPFLPISFFKTHTIQTGSFEPEAVFESSGTTQTINSRHYVKDLSVYQRSFTAGFERFYGSVNDWCIIGLLPSYLERQNSSLVVMVDELIKRSGHPQSGFYLYEFEKLSGVLLELEKQKQKTILIGVTFALLDFAEKFPMNLHHTVVMETGGMKGRRRELTRVEVHQLLKGRLGIGVIHAEYGMTELLSQAYSGGEGIFEPVPWMRVLVRSEDDPLDVQEQGGGIINIIDLANIHSCSFIATDDAGKVFGDRRFEIWGRVDNSDLRGCSLMIV
jgi:hypothetical protein